MVPASLVIVQGVVAAAFGGPLRFDPVEPRAGDLLVVYADVADPDVVEGALEAFGYEMVLHRVSKASLRGFVPVPVDVEVGPHVVRSYFGGDVHRATVTVQDRAFESTELSVGSRFTRRRKPKRLRRRIRRERKAIQALWDRTPTTPLAAGPFLRPTPTEVTGRFGTRRVFNGQTKSRHYGLDLDGEIGDPVHAVLTGRVVMSTVRFYSGGTIVLDHGSGLFTLYFHLSRRIVRKGDVVRAGQRIGSVGNTGRTTGPHLHLGVAIRAVFADGEKAGKTRSMYVDPERALSLVLEADPAVLGLPSARKRRSTRTARSGSRTKR